MTAANGRVAPGSSGAGLIVRAYRRSPLRWLRRVYWDHRGLRDNDVFLASYPRSGNVWLRFLILELARGDASFLAIQRDLPYVGWQAVAGPILPGAARVIKTHEPYRPMYRRAIHLVRDPRDVCLSYFRFLQRMERIAIGPEHDPAASLDHFIDAMIGGRVDAYTTWQQHTLSWLRAAESQRADILRLRFEDVRADPADAVARVGTWLKLELPPGRAAEVAAKWPIDSMRAAENHAVAHTPQALPVEGLRTGVPLIGEGNVEGWRTRLTPDQVARFAAFGEGMKLMGYALT